jgi:GAF domain-containing protein
LVVAAAILESRFALFRATFWVFTPRATVRAVARWSASRSVMAAGDEVSIDLTPTMTSLADRILQGGSLLFDPSQVDLGLMSDLLQFEGERSTLVLPLFDGEGVVGCLSLGSANADAFSDGDVALLGDIARRCQDRLLDLALESGA